METILLVILIIIVISMIGLVLLQRSEGGALGIGGPGAMFSARGTANLLTRATAGLAAAFMILSLVLAILSGSWTDRESVLDTAGEEPLAVEEEPLGAAGRARPADRRGAIRASRRRPERRSPRRVSAGFGAIRIRVHYSVK